MELNQQIHSAVEYLMELRSLTVTMLQSEIAVNTQEKKGKKERFKEFIIGILIVVLLGMSIKILNIC